MSFKLFALTPISAALLAIATSTHVLAADEKIETIYISATRAEGPLVPVATQIVVIDAEQIRKSGASSITEVLRTQAGIQIQDLDGSGGRNVTVSMRGFSSNAANNTLVMVDGRKLNNPSLAGPALNTIAIKNIERVEIIQGSAGVLYGDQAVGGVINIITRKAQAGEINGELSAQRGSDDLENYTASINQGFANGLNYSISAQKHLADNYRVNNESDSSNLLGNLGFSFDKGNVFVEKQRIQDDLQIPGALAQIDTEKNPRDTKMPNDFSTQETRLSRAGGEVAFYDQWKFLGEYAVREESGNALFDDYDKSNGYFPYEYAYLLDVKNISPRIVGNLNSKNGISTVTIGYDQMDADYQTKDGYSHFGQKQKAAYAQIIYPATKNIALTMGARHAQVDDEDEIIKTSHKDSVNAGEFGINLQLTPQWRAFARAADGFRFANADENGYKLLTVDFLEIQTSQSQEVGVAWAENNASVKYSVFHMNINNEIMFDPLSGLYGANINLPKSERRGLLFDAATQLSDQIGLQGNYTYTDAHLTSGNFEDKNVPYVAQHTANLALLFSFTKEFTARIDANYTGSRYLIGDNANMLSQITPVTLFNANIVWVIESLELGFRIKNLTGERYADYQGTSWSGIYLYPQPGRTYDAHLTYRF